MQGSAVTDCQTNPRDVLHHGKQQNLKTVTWP